MFDAFIDFGGVKRYFGGASWKLKDLLDQGCTNDYEMKKSWKISKIAGGLMKLVSIHFDDCAL